MINFLNIKLKGIGAATLDRGVALVIGASVLASVVAGVSWLYKTSDKEALINDINLFANAIHNYYPDSEYGDIDMTKVRKSGYLPANVNVEKVGKFDLTIRGRGSSFSFVLSDVNYTSCIALGKNRLDSLVNIHSFTASKTYLANKLPLRSSNYLDLWENFCSANKGGGLILNFS